MLQSGIIEMTPRFHAGEGRPARLYRYRADAVAEVKARRCFHDIYDNIVRRSSVGVLFLPGGLHG